MAKFAALWLAILLSGCSTSTEQVLQQEARAESTCRKSHNPGTAEYDNCLHRLAQLRERQPQTIWSMIVDGAPSAAGVWRSVPEPPRFVGPLVNPPF